MTLSYSELLHGIELGVIPTVCPTATAPIVGAIVPTTELIMAAASPFMAHRALAALCACMQARVENGCEAL